MLEKQTRSASKRAFKYENVHKLALTHGPSQNGTLYGRVVFINASLLALQSSLIGTGLISTYEMQDEIWHPKLSNKVKNRPGWFFLNHQHQPVRSGLLL